MSFVFQDQNNSLCIVDSSSNESVVYTHIHRDNFNEGAAEAYFKGKQSHGRQMLARYRSRFIGNQNIALSKNAENLFNLSTVEGQESLISAIENSMVNGLNDAINRTTIEQVLNQATMARNAYKETQSVDNVLKYVREASELLSTKGNALAAILLNYENGSIGSLSGLKQILQKKLTAVNGKTVGFKNNVLNSVAQHLISLISKAETEAVSIESMSTYITNIFSKQIGEGLIAVGVGSVLGKGVDEAINTLMSGTKVPISKGSDYDEYEALKNQTFKPDIVAENYAITVQREGDQSFNVVFDLGLSGKSYSSLGNGGGDSVSVVSEKPFNQLLAALFSDGKYHVSNTLGHLSSANQAYKEMKKAILLSYADNFIAGTGGGLDFVHFVIINGYAYPVYEILQSVVQNTSGALSSEKGTSSDPVIVSISGAGKVESKQSEYDPSKPNLKVAWDRAHEINKIISGLKIHASLRPYKI